MSTTTAPPDTTPADGAAAAPSAVPVPAVPEPATSLAVIGVDPGQTWTAAVLRVGDFAEHGWTMGPVDRFGQLERGALNEVDDWAAFSRYVDRLRRALDELVDYAVHRYGAVRLGVEVPHVPIGWRPGSNKKFNALPMRDWVVPRQVTAAVLGAYPEARLVTPDGHGGRPAGEYPAEVRGSRPHGWGPNETPRRERDHERSAYDVAGIAATMP